MEYKRGDVYLVNLEPALGFEIRKTRPAVIIQNDVGNKFSPTVIIAPITTGKDLKIPTEVAVKSGEGGLKNDSLIRLQQIRTLDKRRLKKRWGSLAKETMQKVDTAIKISLELVPI